MTSKPAERTARRTSESARLVSGARPTAGMVPAVPAPAGRSAYPRAPVRILLNMVYLVRDSAGLAARSGGRDPARPDLGPLPGHDGREGALLDARARTAVRTAGGPRRSDLARGEGGHGPHDRPRPGADRRHPLGYPRPRPRAT